MSSLPELFDTYADAVREETTKAIHHQIATALRDQSHWDDSGNCGCVPATDRAQDVRTALWNAINRELESVPSPTAEVVAQNAHLIARVRLLEESLDKANAKIASVGMAGVTVPASLSGVAS